MTKTEFLTKLTKRLRSYDFCATLLDDEWSERMSERAMAYFTDEEDNAINGIEDGMDDQEVRAEAIQLVLSAFLWYQIKNQLNQKKLKGLVEKVEKAAKSSHAFCGGFNDDLLEVKDYLVSLTNGDFLLGVKSKDA